MSSIPHEQLVQVVANAESRLAALREKHPKLGAYLVFFLRGDQIGIRSTGSEILKAIPKMILDGPPKAGLKTHLKKKPKKDAKESVQEAWREKLEELEKQLTYNPEGRVELRFPNLNYEIIDQLRTDPLVDQGLTPQTRASIRIVLGSLEGLLASNPTTLSPNP